MRKQQRPLTADDVERRLRFILAEAALSDPIYDQTVRMAFRVVSNFYCVGRDCGPDHVYEHTRYRSAEAHKTFLSGNWKGELHNEHQEPLKLVWDWIRKAGHVTTRRLEERLRRWPMVVLTRTENSNIPKRETNPIKRYAGIEVLYRGDDNIWAPRDLRYPRQRKNGG